MPDRQTHLAKAIHNESLSQSLEGTPNNDWAVTTMFYSALHLVDACLAPTQHPRTHVIRKSLVAQDARLRPIRNHYRELEDRSRDARYDCMNFNDRRVRDLRTTDFEPLRQHLRRILGI